MSKRLELCLVFVLACSLHSWHCRAVHHSAYFHPNQNQCSRRLKAKSQCTNEEATSEQLVQIQFGYTMIILSSILALNKFQSILNTKVLVSFLYFNISPSGKISKMYLRSVCQWLALGIRRLQHDWPKKNSQHFSKTFQYHLITIIHHLYHIYAQ